jgi:hypothetical protein
MAAKETGPSTATIKRLFALSNNHCAFPKCATSLVEGKTVTGKICHIKARRPGGPRYDATQTETERHSFSNLILMCGVHHDVIDADEEAYTVEYLHRLKEKRESSAQEIPEEKAEAAALLLIQQSVSSSQQSGGITAHTVHVHNYVQADAQENQTDTAGFVPVLPRDGSARFRTTGEPLGTYWNLMPFANGPDHEVFLQDGPALWIHLMPRESSIPQDFDHETLLKRGRGPGVTLQPLLWSNMAHLRAEDGIGMYATIDNLARETSTPSVCFAFTSGELWSIDTTILQISGRKELYFLDIARVLVQKLRGYGDFLASLGLEQPFDWIAGLDGVKGWKLKVPPPPNHVSTSSGQSCLTNPVVAKGVYDLQQSPALTLRPFFERLFRACGTKIPEHIEQAIRSDGRF